jgi:hypothetical protein
MKHEEGEEKVGRSNDDDDDDEEEEEETCRKWKRRHVCREEGEEEARSISDL